MNTAGHDVYTGEDQTGDRYGPARVGAGRVDALAAVNTQLLAYSTRHAGAVSASFGVVPVDTSKVSVTKKQTVRVQNTGTRAVDVRARPTRASSASRVCRTRCQPRVARVPARRLADGHGDHAGRCPQSAAHHRPDHGRRSSCGRRRASTCPTPPAGSWSARSARPICGCRCTARRSRSRRPRPRTARSARNPAIILKGKGFAQGTGSTAWTSLASVLQLGAQQRQAARVHRQRTLTDCIAANTERAGDLEYVGAGAAPGANGYADGLLWFGASASGRLGGARCRYGRRRSTTTSMAMASPTSSPIASQATDTDVFLSATVEPGHRQTSDLLPVNFKWGDVDTNVFDSNAMILPVDPAFIGVTEQPTSRSRSRYQAETFTGCTVRHRSTAPARSRSTWPTRASRRTSRSTRTRATSASRTRWAARRPRRAPRRWCCTCTARTASGPNWSSWPARARRATNVAPIRRPVSYR